ncbi:Gfo/Idh/MocA family protein [Mucisphaera sp.]|uniref:Gfo/Idh/MocA family protein n=1 Tax=Mucisphaera sp. TaxID=2913024 RepID=UPI003D09FC88
MGAKREIRFGVIGCGLMGREFASAVGRWCHLGEVDFVPMITAVCDPNPAATGWFEAHVPTVKKALADYRVLLDDPEIDAVYCAVPHHLHERLYMDIVRAGKHLLGEKPFGIDREANRKIMAVIEEHPDVLVRCSSEFPFFPGAYQITRWVEEGRFGKLIDVEAGFWHSSDLDPNKAINWKRMIASNGAYGCMGDLGMHVLHLPLRYGWRPGEVRALLANVMRERPGAEGELVACETWDNAILATTFEHAGEAVPMVLSTKRIAPGHANTWFIRINGTAFSAAFSTKDPKCLRSLPYVSGGEQAWHVVDTAYKSAYPTITGGIFEFGFSDSILQMWAAFCDELVHGREGMMQPFTCARPEEAAASHDLFTAALASEATGRTVTVDSVKGGPDGEGG